MKTVSTVIDSTVLLTSAIVVVGAASTVYKAYNLKSNLGIALGCLTVLVGVYAFRESSRKLNS